MLAYLPKLSVYDPPEAAEGTIDPLGLTAIAESLANILAPGIRERQSRPRFLTTMAAGKVLCSALDASGRRCVDGESEPWQVYEWLAVEGFVREVKDSASLRGIPGREKVGRAIKNRVPISASQYLKTPSIFGFHGVYRVLANKIGIESNGQLGEVGAELVQIWEKEQSLSGFFSGVIGPGAFKRKQLHAAIDDGLREGFISKSSGWAGWSFFSEHLLPNAIGKNEASFLAKAILNPKDPLRKELLEFLISSTGKKAWQSLESERDFHTAALQSGSKELRILIEAIQAYESFARILFNAFEDTLDCLTRTSASQPLSILSGIPSVVNASVNLPRLFDSTSHKLASVGLAQRFEKAFANFQMKQKPADWVRTLIEHHVEVQRNKPPEGKNSWLEQLSNGNYVVRSAYARESSAREDDAYVHPYRTFAFWSFLEDLGLVKNG